MQFRNYGIAIILGAILLGLIALTLFLLVTSVIWIPLLIVLSPILGLVYLIFKKTPVGSYANQLYLTAYDWAFYRSEDARRFLWQEFYNFICWLYPQVEWRVMNYGYAVLNGDGKLVQNLPSEFETERFPLQLYHYIATSCGQFENLSGKTVLEVGSGRGGGLNYISKNLNPKKCIGVDISMNQVEFCRELYKDNLKLEFHQGDSENLGSNPVLKDMEFDLIINVESSHCYGNFDKFVQGVDKLLRPGGVFAITDFRPAGDIANFEKALTAFNMKMEKNEDITINVVKALKLDEKRRIDLINNSVHSILRPLFKKFSGLNGSRINEALVNNETLYKVCILKKSK